MTQIATFDSSKCSGRILQGDDGWTIIVEGNSKVPGSVLKYMAPSPPDFRMSYMGSGLPFANEDMAYEGTRNRGEVAVNNGSFKIILSRPNAYYVDNGAKLVSPRLHFTIGQEYFDIDLGLPAMPDRSLSSLPGRPQRATGR